MANVSIDNLASEITKTIQRYTEDVSDAIDKKVDEVADLVLAEAKKLAPKRTGKYARALKKTASDQYGKTRRIIWNKRYFSLVHLLEFGHATRNGGRTKKYPHMQDAYKAHGPSLPDEIKKIIRNGG